MDFSKIASVLAKVKAEGRSALLETEGAEVLHALGIDSPRYTFLRSSKDAAGADFSLLGERAVVKVISPEILHKTEVGGVQIVENRREVIEETVRAMEKKFSGQSVAGYTVNEFVKFSPAMGRELLIGMRWTEDFGPVVSFGPGGIYAEFYAKHFKPGQDVAILSPGQASSDDVTRALKKTAVSEIVFGGFRKQPPLVDPAKVVQLVSTFVQASSQLMAEGVTEFECNPVVITERGLVALDVLIKVAPQGKRVQQPDRPVQKLKQLLEPKSAAIIGVSEKGMNMGRIILQNFLRDGFKKDELFIVKPGSTEIDGCACVPDVASLPKKMDLFVLSVSAAQAPDVLTEVVKHKKADSVIVIPGGFEEKSGTEAIVSRMHAALREARASDWKGPVINGGNCLGIRSVTGRYNTMFIPEYKLPMPQGRVSPVALISQSGAFAITKMNKLATINPKFAVSLGNQMDLTIGDYLSYLKDDPSIRIYAVYVEGFRPLDGLKFLEAARAIREMGKTVILYRAGRTAEGAKASSSHTASIAGDYAVTRELALAAGVVVAESLEDFEDVTTLFALLEGKKARGRNLGVVSNAGFECVAAADSLGQFKLANPSEETHRRLTRVFEEAKISGIVDVHNPLDLTPMSGDAVYDASVRAFLEDTDIDVVVVGCVPFAVTLNTLPSGPGHSENLTDAQAFAPRMGEIVRQSKKPLIAVVDSGPQYDALVAELIRNGLPTFRTVDRALRLFNLYCCNR